MRASASLRWWRATLVALVASCLGGLAHVSAGGRLPGGATLVALGVVLTVVSAASLGGPASYVRILALVGGGQAVVHLVLTASAGHPGRHAETVRTAAAIVGPGLPAPARGGVLEDLRVFDPATAGHTSTPPPQWMEHLSGDLTGPHVAMAVAHLAAAALVAGWLFLGEAALWALVALLGRRVLRQCVTAWWLSRPQQRPSSGGAATRSSSVVAARRLVTAVRDGTAARRGPPSPAVCPPSPVP